jgi:hypothetical protein
MLSDCLVSRRSTIVDLSEVTFMDSRCVWKLAVYYQLGRGPCGLCNPSQDVGVSVAAYDLEDWLDFIYTTDPRLPGCAAANISHKATSKRRKVRRPCINYIQR